MAKKILLPLLLSTLLFGGGCIIPANGQQISDSTIELLRSKILGKQNHLSYHGYVDTYFTGTINSPNDTSNLIPFSANSPVRDEIRMNVAALVLCYNAENARSTISIQFGDAPNLLASPSTEWINNIRQANFGVRIVKNLWLDLGYMINVVGYESAWAVENQISFLTVGGYFEPGNVLGIKLSWQLSEKFSGGIMMGNPYSIAYSHNDHLAGYLFLTYQPLPNLSVNYNNFFGKQTPQNTKIKDNVLYNNLFVTWDPGKHVELVGELDFGSQTNSGIPPDTNTIATMFSGFLQAGYSFNDHFGLTARYEFFNDPDGFLSGINDDSHRGTGTNGFSCSFEYKPIQISYFRLAYRYLGSYPGSKEFYSKTSDQMQAIYVSAGIRF